MKNKVIAITLFRRPRYTAELLEKLKKCYGIRDYEILISCDYDPAYAEQCDEVVQMASAFSIPKHRASVQVFINNPRLGVDLNKLFILPKAFALSDYVIFLEDDTPIARDGLRYFEAMGEMFEDDQSVISISGYNRYTDEAEHTRILVEEPYAVDRIQKFTPWGWAMWRDRYEKFMGDGEAYKAKWGTEANGRFDWWFTEAAKETPLYSVYPVLPRSQHVGAEDAEHTPSAEWLMENEFNPFGSWSQAMPDPLAISQEWTKKW